MRRQTYMFIVLAAASAAIYAFGEHTIYTLIAGSLGIATMVISSISEYRPGVVIGMLVAVAAASVSSPLDTMTEAGAVLTAAVGFFIPVAAIVWFSLSAGLPEETRILSIRKPVLVASVFAAICLISVPISIGVVSIFSPQVTTRISELEEISVIIVVVSIGAIILSSREPKEVIELEETESSG